MIFTSAVGLPIKLFIPKDKENEKADAKLLIWVVQ